MTYPPNPGEPQFPPASNPQPYPHPPAGFVPPPVHPFQYGAGPFGAPGYPPPKKSNVVPIVVTSVALVLILCVGGVAALFVIGSNVKDDTAKITITEPFSLGGRAKVVRNGDEDMASLLDDVQEMEDELAAYPRAQNWFGAIYGDFTEDNAVVALALKAVVRNPRRELTASFANLGATGLVPADSGALGGIAECGVIADEGDELAVCGWADEGSIGVITWLSELDGKAPAEFPRLRAEIETKTG
jgi:hypothetical protein